jgi:Fe-S cluster biogenesis protein NfuA
MTNPAAEAEFRSRVEKLDSLLHDLESCGDPAVRSKSIEAVQTLMEFHGTGLSKIVDYIAGAGPAGSEILSKMAKDDLVSSLLLLYELHPADFDTRVRQALDKVRPIVRQHGASLELVALNEGKVHVRIERSGHACGSTAGKIKTAIEEAILDIAPEVVSIEIDGLAPPGASAGFVPVEQLLGHSGRSKPRTGEAHELQIPAQAAACAGHE